MTMKLKKSVAVISAAITCLAGPNPAFSDDIDVFVGGNSSSQKPNVLLILDNSSNWSGSLAPDTGTGADAPADGDTTTKRTKFYHEMKALGLILDGLGKCKDPTVTDNATNRAACASSGTTVGDGLRLGLMFFSETGTNGGYVRYAIRDMTPTNRNALKCMLTGKDNSGNSCGATSPGLVMSGADTDNSASNQPYAKVMYEAYKYYGGWSSPAYAQKDQQPPGAVNDATHFGPRAYAGWGTDSGSDKGAIRRDYPNNNTARSANKAFGTYPSGDNGAFVAPSSGTAKDSNTYNDPISDGCAKNFIIFVSNGNPGTGGDSGGTSETTLLSNVMGSTTPIINSAGAVIHASYGDEFARFLYQTDVSSQLGQQNVISYTMAVYDHDDFSQTSTQQMIKLMSSMAAAGGGNYFEATKGSEIVSGLLSALNQIMARDSTFVTASLPVNTNAQGEFLNQVFIGMFRPDSAGTPRWWGNVKQYRLACMDGVTEDLTCGPNSLVQLVDSSTPNPKVIYSAGTAFIDAEVSSFWTKPSTFWTNSPRGTSATPTSDGPDGEVVEKGGVAQRLRERFATDQSGRAVLTCSATGTAAANNVKSTCTAGTALPNFNYTGSGSALSTSTDKDKFFTVGTGAAGDGTAIPTELDLSLSSTGNYDNLNSTQQTTEFQRLVNWVRGTDNINPSDESGPGGGVTVRPSIHGDVVHSRPVALDFGTDGVILFYGDNHGHLHAVKGATDITSPTDGGKELWSFVAPEFFPKLARLRANLPALLTPITPSGITPAPLRKDYFWDGAISAYQNKTTNTAHLFVSARRGGRFIYALDVSSPASPKFLWKIDETTTGFSNIGQTWSAPIVTKVKFDVGGVVTNKLVLIFGGGYPGDYQNGTTSICEDAGGTDGVRDHTTPPCDRGRGVYVVDASNGHLLKHITGNAIQSRTAATPAVETSIAMEFAIPSDVYPMDSDFDGITDRLYVGDLGGHLWRIELSDPAGNTDNWKPYLLGSFGEGKKIFFRPAVVQQNDYTAVLVGSGDREKPLASDNSDGFFMVKDKKTAALTNASTWNYYSESDLCDMEFNGATTACSADGATTTENGWRLDFESTGEKVVNSPRVAFSIVNFATNVPQANSPGQCFNNGQARSYQVNFDTGISAFSSGSPYTIMEIGGLAPTAFVGIVDINGNKVPVVIGGGVGDGGGGGGGGCIATPTKACSKTFVVPSTRTKRYWNKKKD